MCHLTSREKGGGEGTFCRVLWCAGVRVLEGDTEGHGMSVSGRPGAQKQVSSSERLRQIEADFWDWRMQEAPMFSTAVGESRHNDVLESYLPDVYTQRQTQVQQYISQLSGVDRAELSQEERLDLDIFTDHLNTFLAGARFNSYFAVNPVNFLEGTTAEPSYIQTTMPFSTPEDFDNYLERLEHLPAQIDQQTDLLRTAVSTGHTLNKVSVTAVPGQIDDITGRSVDLSPFYQPAFTSTLDNSHLSDDQKERLRSKATQAVGNINEALQRLNTYLEQSYMPAARHAWGVCGWPDGRQVYEQCLKYHTSTDMTPQQVHDLGLQEVARIRGNMDAALKRLGFKGTVREFFLSIRSDPRFHLDSSEALLETYRDYIYNRILPKLTSVFKDIPSLPLKVEAMPYKGPAGIYRAGTADGSKPAIFYANVSRPQDQNIIGITSFVLHETVPGHHLQSAYSLTSNIPKYRSHVESGHYCRMPASFPRNTAYTEGWGLYAEYLGEELGMYTDDYLLMGRYSAEIGRACRLVVDTGLHCFGWERERAVQYMLNNTALTPGRVSTEIDRYLTWPGQATAYKIGEIRIKQLRQKASDALGEKFELPEFHSVILKNGGMPLNLLERLVEDWVVQVKATDTSPVSGQD